MAYAISMDGEDYHGDFATREEAIAEGPEDESFWIGKLQPPAQPEEYFDASDWLEHVSCQDEYDGDWADAWDASTAAQRGELEREVRKVMADWLDRHKLRPTFFVIDDVEKVTRVATE